MSVLRGSVLIAPTLVATFLGPLGVSVPQALPYRTSTHVKMSMSASGEQTSVIIPLGPVVRTLWAPMSVHVLMATLAMDTAVWVSQTVRVVSITWQNVQSLSWDLSVSLLMNVTRGLCVLRAMGWTTIPVSAHLGPSYPPMASIVKVSLILWATTIYDLLLSTDQYNLSCIAPSKLKLHLIQFRLAFTDSCTLYYTYKVM